MPPEHLSVIHALPHLPTVRNDGYSPHLPRSWMASSNLSSSMAFCTSFVLKRKDSQVVKEARLTQPAGLEEGLLADIFICHKPSFQEAQEAHQAPSMSPSLVATDQSWFSPSSKPLRVLGMRGPPNPTSQAHNQYPTWPEAGLRHGRCPKRVRTQPPPAPQPSIPSTPVYPQPQRPQNLSQSQHLPAWPQLYPHPKVPAMSTPTRQSFTQYTILSLPLESQIPSPLPNERHCLQEAEISLPKPLITLVHPSDQLLLAF